MDSGCFNTMYIYGMTPVFDWTSGQQRCVGWFYAGLVFHVQVRRDELDLLYRVFDTNRNGFLELGEVVKHQERMDKSFAWDQATARAATGFF